MSFVEQLREELVTAATREQARTRPRVALPPLRPLVVATAGIALTAILVIAIATGLNTNRAGDERAVKPPAPEGRELFDGTLFPGERYRTRNFIPALSFVVTDDNWQAFETATPDVLVLDRVIRGGPSPLGPRPALVFQRIAEVYDPEVRDLQAARMDAPPDLVAWFARHPDLRVSRPEPVTVAGVPGVSANVEVRFTRPTHDDPFCRERFRRVCTFLGPKASLLNGMRLRVIQLRTEPEPLMIFTAAISPRKLDALNRVTAPVLDSLRIGIR
jgi:hypothetical protein